jgi:hypothetical protein
LAEAVQEVVTRKMEIFNRGSLKLPEIAYPREGFQAVFMKVLEEK